MPFRCFVPDSDGHPSMARRRVDVPDTESHGTQPLCTRVTPSPSDPTTFESHAFSLAPRDDASVRSCIAGGVRKVISTLNIKWKEICKGKYRSLVSPEMKIDLSVGDRVSVQRKTSKDCLAGRGNADAPRSPSLSLAPLLFFVSSDIGM